MVLAIGSVKDLDQSFGPLQVPTNTEVKPN